MGLRRPRREIESRRYARTLRGLLDRQKDGDLDDGLSSAEEAAIKFAVSLLEARVLDAGEDE